MLSLVSFTTTSLYITEFQFISDRYNKCIKQNTKHFFTFLGFKIYYILPVIRAAKKSERSLSPWFILEDIIFKKKEDSYIFSLHGAA